MLLKENSVRDIQVEVYGFWMKAYDANAPNRRHPTIRPCCVASGFPVIWLKCSEGYDVMTYDQTPRKAKLSRGTYENGGNNA